MKWCYACDREKPDDEFGKNAVRRDGRQTACKACRKSYDAARYAEKGAAILANRRTPEWRRARQARTHGLTLEELDGLINRFDGLCWSCREAPGTDVDHCHRSGRRRGWLCHPCNVGLGHFGDDPQRLRAAAVYLES